MFMVSVAYDETFLLMVAADDAGIFFELSICQCL
jgi:hypothetical protein